jgi:hypothetical protein
VQIHDPTQLRGAGCGSMSSYIHAALDGPRLELTENRRQRSEDERAALTAWREGRYEDALAGWAGAGQVVATHTSDQGVAAMVSTWMRLAEGAPDPHTRADGLLMIAKTNEQVTRINQAVQAVRAAQEQLGEGRSYALPAGREVTFHIGDQVLYRRNDRHQQAVTGEPVLNGYRGVVTGITAAGVQVAWRQPDDTDDRAPHTGVCSPGYIAEGGLELGYALTTHKAEGMTVDGEWDRPDGTRNEGDVLVWTPGMDAGGGYVSLSRDRGRTYLFGALEEVEGEREQLLYGAPRDQAELTQRVVAALAERAEATATCVDDRPVLVDLGQAPADPTPDQRTQYEQHQPSGEPADRQDQKPTAKQGTEREPAVEVTDAQRQRWDQLAAQSTLARIKGDPDAQQAVEEEQRTYAEELGPERVEVLRQEVRDRLDREAQRAWWERPHGTLDDTELAQAVLQAEHRRVAHLAAVEQARAQLTETEPAVAESRGPAITQLDTTLAELRRMLELRTRADDVERRWESTGTQPGWRPRKPALKKWRPGGHRGTGPDRGTGAWPRPPNSRPSQSALKPRPPTSNGSEPSCTSKPVSTGAGTPSGPAPMLSAPKPLTARTSKRPANVTKHASLNYAARSA